MKAIISINSDIKKSLEGDDSAPGYGGTRDLYNHFEKRGHEVSFICPNEINNSEEGIFKAEYKIDNNQIKEIKRDSLIYGDVFFMRGFGQDKGSIEVTKNFFQTLKNVEQRFGLMVNSPFSVWFDLKDYQKELDLPFIPSPAINKISDLERELENGSKIVAKPKSGFQTRGIFFLDNPNQIKGNLDKENIKEYVFEHGIFGDEPRYLFLDGEIIGKRNLVKPEIFGIQKTISLEMRDPFENEDEIKIVEKAMGITKMFYGCVDFKGKYILELNGSGTNQFATYTDGTNRRYYDFGEKIVQKIEEKLS